LGGIFQELNMDAEKRDFVWKRGVWGVGLPVGVMMALTFAMQVPGYLFRLQSFNAGRFLAGLSLFVPLFLAAGYVWGLIVFKFRRKS
jgi:hypothetical protein